MTKAQRQEVERKLWALVTLKAATDMKTFVALLWSEAFSDLCKAVDSRREMEDTLRRGVEQQKASRTSYEDQGTGYDSGACGYELAGRKGKA